MHQVNPLLAKLLAKENLTVEHGNYKTAWFDVKNRVLGLPVWKDHGKDVYDLLVGHEVGHALYTPLEGIHSSNDEIKGCPRSYINVVEDARIERKIRETYPGLIRTFKSGYKKLFDSGLFGEGHDFDTIKLIDKINLKSKLADLIDVPFNDEELELYYETMNTQTFSDVCIVVKKILAYQQDQEQPSNQNEDPQPESTDSNDNSSDEMGHDDQPSTESNDSEPNVSESDTNESNSDTDLDEESPVQDEDGESTDNTISDEEEETENESGVASVEPEHSDEEVSVTDEMFRSNEEQLLDVNDNGEQTLFITDYNQKERDKLVISYAKLAESRAEKVGRPGNQWKEIETHYEVRTHCNRYIKEVKKAVQPAVKEFEMKKAAFQWQRASTAKTGSINVDQLHSYKYNEDIFARVTQMADAKNHGMMLLIDYSGSMYNVIANVIQQTMHLVSFCKAVNIPFTVYAFTSGMESVVRNNVMETDGLALVELINSDLKKKDYEEAMYNLALRPFSEGLIEHENKHKSYRFNYKEYISKFEDFGSTPLNQALIVSTDLIKKFKARHKIEKFNFVTITDGDANRIRTYRSGDDNTMPIESTYRSDGKVKIQVGNKSIDAYVGGKDITTALLNNIRKTYNVNTIGFFISERNAEFNYRCAGAAMAKSGDEWVDNSEVRKQAGKEYKKNKCVEFNDVYGYNTYYMIKGGQNALDTSDDEFNPTTTKSIGNDFKKYSKSKKTNKVLMQKIGAAVA